MSKSLKSLRNQNIDLKISDIRFIFKEIDVINAKALMLASDSMPAIIPPINQKYFDNVQH